MHSCQNIGQSQLSAQADLEKAEAALRSERSARADLERKVGAAEARIAGAEGRVTPASHPPPPQRVTSPVIQRVTQPVTQRATSPATHASEPGANPQTADGGRGATPRASPAPAPAPQEVAEPGDGSLWITLPSPRTFGDAQPTPDSEQPPQLHTPGTPRSCLLRFPCKYAPFVGFALEICTLHRVWAILKAFSGPSKGVQCISNMQILPG